MGGKIDRSKVIASLTTICPKCGHKIQPSENNAYEFYGDALPEVQDRVRSRKEVRLNAPVHL